MFTQHPTLLIGPSDWDRSRMPEAEFAGRIEALWARFPEATRAIVYGTSSHHAELAYLTNLVPKLEAAAALISRGGERPLFIGGGPNMVGAAQPLTFIRELMPLRGGEALAKVALEGIGTTKQEILVIGTGYMPPAFRRSLMEPFAGRITAIDATAELWSLMRRKSSREIDAIREACRLLNIAIDAIDHARSGGAGVTTTILAGEQAANRAGAQDVRTLFSIDGGWRFRPFVSVLDQRADPLQVYVAVRRFNYWAEGFVMLSDRPNSFAGKAARALRFGLRAVNGGAPAFVAKTILTGAVSPNHVHPVTVSGFANAIGITLQEPPYTDVGKQFEAGEVYSVRAGITDRTDNHGIVSAMVIARERGNEVLWMRDYEQQGRK